MGYSCAGTRTVELDAVRRARAELAQLVAEHPELTSPDAQARLARHLSATERLTTDIMGGTADDMASNARPAVNIRLEPGLIEALEMAAAAVPALSRHALCRASLYIGLAAIAADPALALAQPIGARQPLPIKAPAKSRKRSKTKRAR
jgi:hypothetical protein